MLKRKLSNNDVWTYTDELITKNGQVYQLNHDEGRVTLDYAANRWVYEYDYRDHQGNLRLSFRDSLVAGKPPVVTQIHETDPFGLEIRALSYENSGSNTFKFQNQEKINDFGLNWNFFAYRFSDGETGRFFQIDPLASKYVHNSPYAFSENKVTNHLELEGLEAVPVVYPSLQNELYRAGGLTHQPSQKENESFAVRAAIQVAKTFAMIAAIALPIEEAIVVGAGAALKGLGLIVKEVGVVAKVESSIVKVEGVAAETKIASTSAKSNSKAIPQKSEGYQVTPEGVAFEKTPKTTIPDNYVENPNRTGNYGVIDPKTGKFVEKLRIDPATPTGKKGPENSHYHVDNSKEHYSPKPGDKNPGFQ